MNRRQQSEQELDLSLASEIQAALLPKTCPVNCDHQVAAARNRMCSGVGGDFYDFIRLNDDQAVMLIGDVVGHGVRASLMMAQIMGYLRTDLPNRSRPTETTRDLNRMLIDLGNRTNSVMPCSLFYAVIDAPSGITFFVNAGHPRPFLYDRQTPDAVRLGALNMVLGVEDFQPEEDCITFTPGQRLILFTDGVPDAADEQGRHFGEVRLHEVVSRCADLDAEHCADAVFQAVTDFRGRARQPDDETVIVIDRV